MQRTERTNLRRIHPLRPFAVVLPLVVLTGARPLRPRSPQAALSASASSSSKHVFPPSSRSCHKSCGASFPPAPFYSVAEIGSSSRLALLVVFRRPRPFYATQKSTRPAGFEGRKVEQASCLFAHERKLPMPGSQAVRDSAVSWAMRVPRRLAMRCCRRRGSVET